MKITSELVDRLAELSKLSFTAEEKQTAIQDLENIFGLIEKLEEVNVDGVQPLIYLSGEAATLRKDLPSVNISREEALVNAPQHDSDYFKVPKVIRQKK